MRTPRALKNEMVVFAILLILLVSALVVAAMVRLVKELKKWQKFRTLLKDWLDERQADEGNVR